MRFFELGCFAMEDLRSKGRSNKTLTKLHYDSNLTYHNIGNCKAGHKHLESHHKCLVDIIEMETHGHCFVHKQHSPITVVPGPNASCHF